MRSYNILILGALPVEIKQIKASCKNLHIPGILFHFLLTGVGNYNCIFETQKFLEQRNNEIDFILNLGVCGKRDTTTSDEVFQVYRIKHLHNQRESLCPLYVTTKNLQSIGCGEKIVTEKEFLGAETYVDMESYGVDFVSKKMKIPHVIIKFPFDIVGKGSKNVSQNDIASTLSNYDYKTLFTDIKKWCEKNIHQTPDWEQYKKEFGLSVSETEIFKKQYNKIIAFGGDPISFLKDNSAMQKKQLLQKMQDIKDV